MVAAKVLAGPKHVACMDVAAVTVSAAYRSSRHDLWPPVVTFHVPALFLLMAADVVSVGLSEGRMRSIRSMSDMRLVRPPYLPSAVEEGGDNGGGGASLPQVGCQLGKLPGADE